MSQTALEELTVRREDGKIRPVESPKTIYWADFTEMGAMMSQQWDIANLEILVLGYGD